MGNWWDAITRRLPNPFVDSVSADPFDFFKNRTDTNPKKIAVILNLDSEERHVNNVEMSSTALYDDGYEVIVVSVKKPTDVDHYIPASQENIRRVLSELKTYARTNDELLFYNTGHGLAGGFNQDINEWIDVVPYHQRTIVMDQCFSGWARTFFADDPRTFLAFSASENEEASCGFFAPYFWANNVPDQNGDGEISFRERYAYAEGFNIGVSHSFVAVTDGYIQAGAPDFPAQVVDVKTADDLNTQIGRLKPGQFALVTFSASWCGPCKEYRPQFAVMAEQAQGQVLFLRTENEALAQYYGVMSYPTVMVFDNSGHNSIILDRNHPTQELGMFQALSPLQVACENIALADNSHNMWAGLRYIGSYLSKYLKDQTVLPLEEASLIDETFVNLLKRTMVEDGYMMGIEEWMLIEGAANNFGKLFWKPNDFQYYLSLALENDDGRSTFGSSLLDCTFKDHGNLISAENWEKVGWWLGEGSNAQKRKGLEWLLINTRYGISQAEQIAKKYSTEIKAMTHNSNILIRQNAIALLFSIQDNFSNFTSGELVDGLIVMIDANNYDMLRIVFKKIRPYLSFEDLNEIFDYLVLLDEGISLQEFPVDRLAVMVEYFGQDFLRAKELELRQGLYEECDVLYGLEDSQVPDLERFSPVRNYALLLNAMNTTDLLNLSDEFFDADPAVVYPHEKMARAMIVIFTNMFLFVHFKQEGQEMEADEVLGSLFGWIKNNLDSDVKSDIKKVAKEYIIPVLQNCVWSQGYLHGTFDININDPLDVLVDLLK
ncbi:thioredoxin family protein [bacterium]|nr:thioredoxin family protein [bacterium]